jgi:hypothetical protein
LTKAKAGNVPFVLVIGTWWGVYQSGHQAAAAQAESDMLTAVANFGDPTVIGYSIMTDGGAGAAGSNTYSWITGNSSTASPNGSGNSDTHVSSVNSHMTYRGQLYFARRIAHAVHSIFSRLN